MRARSALVPVGLCALASFAFSAFLLAAADGCSRTEIDLDDGTTGPKRGAGTARPDASAPDTGEDAPHDAREEPPPDAAGDAPDDASEDAPPDASEDAPPDAPVLCVSDAECKGGTYCDAATCDPAVGCVMTPRDCSDGNDCTSDTCDEAQKRCEHTLDDSLCPDGQLCSATRGCAAFVYAVAADDHLYEVDVPSGATLDIGMTPAAAADVALTNDGTLYAIDSYILYKVNRADATTTAVGSILPWSQYSSLGARPDGTLQTIGLHPEVYRVDPASGAASAIASMPESFFEAGDLTSLNGQLFATIATAPPPSDYALALVDLGSQESTSLGDIGYPCVWGLATLGGVMYGLTCEGRVLVIDPNTGAATQVAQATPAFEGAAGR